MVSEEALELVQYFLKHPKDAVFDFMTLLRDYHNRDLAADGRMVRNLVLCLPDSEAVKYRDEIEFVRGCGQDYFATLMYPYPVVKDRPPVDCAFDGGLGLPYVVHDGKRLYFCEDRNEAGVRRSYSVFVQDEGLLGTGCLKKSPHSYVADDFYVEEGDVVVDIGCSEALFALDNIEKASAAFVFETMRRWKKPLTATFAPFQDKVTIVNKFVGDRTKGHVVLLNDVLKGDVGSKYFIKMDIEGGEFEVLKASTDFLRTHKVKLSCCVYHRQDDERRIVGLLNDLGFTTQLSDGYLLPTIGGLAYPYFRHGVVRARNFD